MKWHRRGLPTPSALAQTTALINDLIAEHEEIVAAHYRILAKARHNLEEGSSK